MRDGAIAALAALSADPSAPGSVRLGAAREILDRSGVVPPRRGTPPPSTEAEAERQREREEAIARIRALSTVRLLARELLRDPETPEASCEEALAVLRAGRGE